MSTQPVILDFRLSFIWTETLLGLLNKALKPKPSFEFLTQSSSYEQLFREVQQSGPSDNGLDVPWKGSREHFWNFYLPGSAGGQVSGKQAWEHLVPLRAKPSLKVDKWPNGQLILEGFYYPHGLAAVCTFRCQGRFAPEEVRDLAYSIRYDELFSVTVADKQQDLSLTNLARKALDGLREAAVESGDQPGRRRDPFEPFSLLTVVKGEDVAPTQPFPQNGPVHQMLDVLSYWPPVRTASPTAFDKATLPLYKRDAAKGSAMFAGKRGRTIWFPDKFTLRKQKVSSLNCYHRNNLRGAMQVDSMGAFVASTVAQLQTGTQLSALTFAHTKRLQAACDRLAELFNCADRTKSERVTYRSVSLKEQLRQNDLADLNTLRAALSGGADLK